MKREKKMNTPRPIPEVVLIQVAVPSFLLLVSLFLPHHHPIDLDQLDQQARP